jgi:hypothetical protein
MVYPDPSPGAGIAAGGPVSRRQRVSSSTSQAARANAPFILQESHEPRFPTIALLSIATWEGRRRQEYVRAPIVLERLFQWPIASADAIICINMIHVSHWVRRSD